MIEQRGHGEMADAGDLKSPGYTVRVRVPVPAPSTKLRSES